MQEISSVGDSYNGEKDTTMSMELIPFVPQISNVEQVKQE